MLRYLTSYLYGNEENTPVEIDTENVTEQVEGEWVIVNNGEGEEENDVAMVRKKWGSSKSLQDEKNDEIGEGRFWENLLIEHPSMSVYVLGETKGTNEGTKKKPKKSWQDITMNPLATNTLTHWTQALKNAKQQTKTEAFLAKIIKQQINHVKSTSSLSPCKKRSDKQFPRIRANAKNDRRGHFQRNVDNKRH